MNSPVEMKNLSITLQRSGKTIGFVPTMGALHQGHLSLLNIAAKSTDATVMSIFVNPSQFGPGEDYDKYPRTFELDSKKAQDAGCDILFAPTAQDMYPPNYSSYVDVAKLDTKLCGATRPDHFRGVCTVVLKFFNIVNPQIAVFGQKDAQQLIVLRRMVSDFNLSVSVESGPVIREKDGLAMSSRNKYLTPHERRDAPLIYKGLKGAKELFDSGERDGDKLIEMIKTHYKSSAMFTPEYIEVVDIVTLEPLKEIKDKALIAVACKTSESKTRLIDNIVLGGEL
ncbi:pantoate--beta-alanine ligase [Chitinispirillales bacterium ANBcel5]|nr:pantoate--beta-alanine ligase [Chitinispirillales bacterium ANBcel5]